MNIRSLALRVAKAVARPIVAWMPPGVQVRARRVWMQLKGPIDPVAAPVAQEPEPSPELTPAASEVWQDLMDARAIAGREPLGGSPSSAQLDGRRAYPG